MKVPVQTSTRDCEGTQWMDSIERFRQTGGWDLEKSLMKRQSDDSWAQMGWERTDASSRRLGGLSRYPDRMQGWGTRMQVTKLR